ncbi:sodium:proton exchanger, partial [Streptomyces sp. NPDC005534]
LVGGDPWAVDLGRALRTAGLDVLMWAGQERQRDLIRAAGLPLAPGELLAAATGEGAELEGITGVLLLTEEDDFNALAAANLSDTVDGFVHRLGPPGSSHGVVAPYTPGDTLFGRELSRPELARRYEAGARIACRPAGEGVPDGHALLFLVRPDGRLDPVTRTRTPEPGAGDTAVLLGPPVSEEVRAWT